MKEYNKPAIVIEEEIVFETQYSGFSTVIDCGDDDIPPLR